MCQKSSDIENLHFHANLHGISKKEFSQISEIELKQVNLWDRKDAKVRSLSGGQKRKVELGDPNCMIDSKTVVLDENAEDLFDIHKYCVEDLQCDTHSFQFLKGSPILGCDFMYKFDSIFESL